MRGGVGGVMRYSPEFRAAVGAGSRGPIPEDAEIDTGEAPSVTDTERGWYDGWQGRDEARSTPCYRVGYAEGAAARARKKQVDAEKGSKVYDRGFRNVGQNECGYSERDS